MTNGLKLYFPDDIAARLSGIELAGADLLACLPAGSGYRQGWLAALRAVRASFGLEPAADPIVDAELARICVTRGQV